MVRLMTRWGGGEVRLSTRWRDMVRLTTRLGGEVRQVGRKVRKQGYLKLQGWQGKLQALCSRGAGLWRLTDVLGNM